MHTIIRHLSSIWKDAGTRTAQCNNVISYHYWESQGRRYQDVEISRIVRSVIPLTCHAAEKFQIGFAQIFYSNPYIVVPHVLGENKGR